MRARTPSGHGSLALAVATLVACSAASKRTALPTRVSAPAASASAVAPPPPACTDTTRAHAGDDEAAKADSAEDEDEEDRQEPPDPAREAELSWARERFPELASYKRVDESLLTRLLDWAKPRETITVYDPECHSVRVTRRGNELHGYAHRGLRYALGDPNEMWEGFAELQIGWRFDEFPSNDTLYRRDEHNNWIVYGSSGFGDARSVGNLLSAVRLDAAWFDDAAISLDIACGRIVEVESRCTQGGKRTCDRCDGWRPFPHSRQSNFGIHRTVTKKRLKDNARVDCSTPCPAIDEPPDVKRANAALEEVAFVSSLPPDDGPLVFRTEAACREYTAKHPRAKNDFSPWRGDGND